MLETLFVSVMTTLFLGFSETETRYQTTDGKVVKLSELKKSKHDMKRIKRWDVSGEAKVTVDRTKGMINKCM